MGTKRISVVGLGKLGLCIAAVFAHRGFTVLGTDIDRQKVELINEGISPIFEPGLEGLLKVNRSHLSATTVLSKAVRGSEVTIIVVPTPSNRLGAFSLRYVNQALRGVGRALSKLERYHLVVVSSTVMPESMGATVRNILEKSSGKRCGKDFGLCYNPQFIALGDVIKGLLEPDFILIGESDRRAGEKLSQICSKVRRNWAPILRMNFINAEIAKIAVNSFVTTKISFANTLAEISEKLPEADVDVITKTLGSDKRIGPSYLRGALGYGGPCFPRDNLAFSFFAQSIGAQAEIARATHRVNSIQVKRILRFLEVNGYSKGTKVGIMGLSYKPRTNVTEESQALKLAKILDSRGYEVRVCDPLVSNDLQELRDSSLVYESSAENCIAGSEICLIAVPHEAFLKISMRSFAGKTVIDCWRILRGSGIEKFARYVPLGVGMN